MTNLFAHCTTLDELKAEYRKLALANHPDRGGDTEAMKRINADHDTRFEQLKAEHNAAADDQHQTTETAEEFRAVIDALLKLHGLNVELCGRWLWISGDTKPHKDELKAIGCRWSPNKTMWYWHHVDEYVGYRRGSSTIGDIRNKYGSQMITADGYYREYKREEIGA